MKTYKGKITELKDNQIFVFGSNIQGRHGKGAALLAKQKFGAIYGKDRGLQGQSYAIVTKDLTQIFHPSISPIYILLQIDKLYTIAKLMIEKEFLIVYSGIEINLNGYTSKQMANMFSVFINIPNNIVFEEEFFKLMNYEK